ncbi:MAG: metallophosphatase family protein [Ignavibacteria bacterium]|nr:metallophosphatase family protein [Ignavibacteria bacterium]
MKYAIISDIHANTEALDVCLKEIDRLKVDRLICLGDLVDYCAEPNEVVKLIKERCDVVILGNHDEAQFNHPLSNGFSENARISSIHTRDVIDPEWIEYFKTLEHTHSESDILFVHASPFTPRAYKYVRSEEAASENFAAFDEKVCFIGHSHQPLIFESSPGGLKLISEGKLNPGHRYIINVGSVGQPRDTDPRLAFGFFDTGEFEYKLIRVEYDIKSASEKIITEGLPEFLARRLFNGD